MPFAICHSPLLRAHHVPAVVSPFLFAIRYSLFSIPWRSQTSASEGRFNLHFQDEDGFELLTIPAPFNELIRIRGVTNDYEALAGTFRIECTLDTYTKGRCPAFIMYHIRIQTRGTAVKCWLNGRLVHEIKDAIFPTQRLYATSALDKNSGDIIVKIVNTAPDPTPVELALEGAKNLWR